MTAENKEWMAHALFLGEDNMNLFADSRWEWISETMDYLPSNQQCAFYRAYVRFGGLNNDTYDDKEALDKAIRYAQDKIEGCFAEITRRLKLEDDEQ